MPQHWPSASISQVGSPYAPRILRLRGDASLGQMLLPESRGDGGRLEVPTREPVAPGDRLRIEVSFGPHVDEVVLNGQVARIFPARRDGELPRVLVRIAVDQLQRTRYIQAILAGEREPSARRHRRIGSDLLARWQWGDHRYASRVRDVSRGGAFIISNRLPPVGTPLRIELLGETGTPGLQLRARVSWIRSAGLHQGFGIRFEVPDRQTATAVDALLRQQEAKPHPEA